MLLPRILPFALIVTGVTALADLPPEAFVALTVDFAQRDRMPQSNLPESEWHSASAVGSWGPRPAHFPTVQAPSGVDPVAWKRARVVAVAKHYLGLPYQHHHIPGWTPDAGKTGGQETCGLDCSNFTAWVYNYGLGIVINSDVNLQADGPKAPGRRLAAGEAFEPGDLLFIQNRDRTKVTHVVIYVDPGHIIDDHADGVRVRPFTGWYSNSFSHARRIIE